MNRAWTATAQEMAATLRTALAGLGGVDLARAAEADPAVRAARLAPVLDSTGVLDLDAFGADGDEAGAAVLAVRACGAVVAPWPVTRVLAVPPAARAEVDAVFVVDGTPTHLDHADLVGRAVAVPVAGDRVHRVRALGGPKRAPLDPFRVAVALESLVAAPVPGALTRATVLDAFWTAGALGSVTRLAAGYAADRRQFGRPIASFGEIRWRIADMAVAADGLDELSAYTWDLARRGRATPADALALRVATQDAADVVLRNGHQVFGAIGLCEEHDLAVIDRHLTPVLLRPAGAQRTTELLLAEVNRHGFDALFPVAPRDVG
ncbi:hypothetical protein BLA60_30955 [Actinophytocola xinjiangensis]|uniref:Acyl-CoA dehydrogenase/oxidase C-terminal domain-containing protein n=1 Tax=Actinophytocola xinjiangensis TaxID=485602 RepID=A0A7Z1AVF2_9PSEU|nr:acyl-CoA dehydrogenase family protein [Actinophytocola xinjiangensis]OLF06683.1 hypothetical protein BLA60_30955 [Actinophytocola xinjiangensis]